jgi:exopolyphosphatase / guanosine-5'-triphosphate,3'-diphosphate pyrophosphatase
MPPAQAEPPAGRRTARRSRPRLEQLPHGRGPHVLGQLRIVDRLREMVRMASGLDGRGELTRGAVARARLPAALRPAPAQLPPHRVRAIATNTVRQLRNPQSFLIAGRDRARPWHRGGLGPRGGAPDLPRRGPGPAAEAQRRLVIDIGGGSTEFIIGEGFEPLERESLQMGCVATTRRFFGDGRLSRKRWKEGLTEVSAEFQQFAPPTARAAGRT